MEEENSQNFDNQQLNFDQYEQKQDQQDQNDVQSLLEIIGPLNNEIFELRSNLESSKGENGKIQRDNIFLQSEVQRLNSEVALLKSQIDEKSAMVSNLEQQKTEYEFQLKTKSSEMKAEMSKIFDELSEKRINAEDYRNLEEEKRQMIQDIGIFEEHIFDLSKEKENLKTTVADLRNEIINDLDTIERMQEDAKVSDTYISDLTQQITSAHEDILQSNAAIEKVNEINISLKQNNELLQKENDSLHDQLQKQSEMISQNIHQNKEVTEAFQDLRSKFEQSENACKDLTEKLNLAREENEYLNSCSQKSDSDRKKISALEFERSELNSRISLLESKLLLSSVKANNAEMAELKQKIQELEEIAESEKSLRDQLEQFSEENETLRSQKDAFDLRISELESHGSSSEELEMYKNKCESLESQINDLTIENDQLNTEKNSLQLKCEQFETEMESKNYEISGLQMKISEMEQNDEDLQKSLNQSEIDSTNLSTEHLHEKRNVIQLQKQIHELDQAIALLTNENSELKRNNQELLNDQRDLSQKILSISTKDDSLREVFENLSQKIQENSQLKDKIKKIENSLSIEAAEHLKTIKELDNKTQLCYKFEQKLRDININYESLATSLSKILNCTPDNNSIIINVSKLHGQLKSARKQQDQIENSIKAQLKSREETNYLKQQIAELQMNLGILTKKNSILQSKLQFNGIDTDETTESLQVNSGIYFSMDNNESSIISKGEEKDDSLYQLLTLSMKNFLQKLIDTKYSTIQNISSIILDELNETGTINESNCTDLADAITQTFCKTGGYLLKLDQIYEQSISTYNQKIDLIDEQLESALNKIGQCKIFYQQQAKQSVDNALSNHKLNVQDEGFVSRIPRKNNGISDYSKPTQQSMFQKDKQGELDRNDRTPSIPLQKKSYNLTPRSSQKKDQTPFRTPLAQLDASITNTFEIETPKLDLPRNTMSKIPVRFVPNGVAPPPTRNFH